MTSQACQPRCSDGRKRRCSCWPLLAAATLLCVDSPPASVSAAAPATAPATREVVDPSRLLQFSLRDGAVMVTTAHPVTDAVLPVEVPGHSSGELMVTRVGPVGRQWQSLRFCVHDIVKGGRVSTSLNGGSGVLQIVRDIETPPREMSIQFIQSPFPAEDGYGVRLYLQGMADEGAGERAVFPARDFQSFIRTHLDVTDYYLRPMLDAMGEAAPLFEVRPALGAEVLADRLVPDEATTRKVMQLVAVLDADAPRQRAAAQSQIEAMGRPAMGVLRRLDRSKLSLEQATRLDTLLAAAAPASGIDAAKLRANTNFVLDALTCEDASVRRAAFAELQQRLHRPLPLDPASPLDVLREKVRALRRELSTASSSGP